jgi:hypothetical protein
MMGVVAQNGFAGIWCNYAVGHPVSACLAARFANAEGSCESSPMKREAQAVPAGSAMGVCHTPVEGRAQEYIAGAIEQDDIGKHCVMLNSHPFTP